MRIERVALRLGGRTDEVVVHPDGRVEAAGGSFLVEPGPGGRYLVSGPEGHVLAHAAAEDGLVWVHAAGEVHVFEAAEGAERLRRRAASEGDLSAPMPAVVRAVLVAAGDTVAAGDVLVVLEAMKMELTVRAPRAGTLAAVRCAPGELVQPGVPLVELA